LFFTRSHAPPPDIDASSWRLRVHGLVRNELELSLQQLKENFPVRELAATLVCAGLRRDELQTVRPIPGELPWGAEPVSTGMWRGASLGDVLEAAGAQSDAEHVSFTGLDDVERRGQRFGFGGSIPLAKAMSSEVLLAYELNGDPLPREHGFPVRAVVPGFIGARSVKWLGGIELTRTSSDNYFQKDAYRILREPASDGSGGADIEMNEVPLNAAILSPESNTSVAAGRVQINGWALTPDGASIASVECSSDNGVTWTEATIYASEGPWAWGLWRIGLDLKPGPHTLVVRCRDGSGASQPAELAEVWNIKGYGNNAWHRVKIHVT
jgi:sulfite oxidase